MIKSEALEANIASYSVDVEIDPRYAPLQEVMSQYYGLMEGVTTFLKELSHPYKNWRFIVTEARSYALDYFHLLKEHTDGVAAAKIYIDVFTSAIEADVDREIKRDAVDNLILYLQKIITDAGDARDSVTPLLDESFDYIRQCDDETFFLFIKSYYQIKRMAALYNEKICAGQEDCIAVSRLLVRHLTATYDYWLGQEDPYQWFAGEVEDLPKNGSLSAFFGEISHERLQGEKTRLHHITQAPDFGTTKALEALLDLVGYGELVEGYRRIPQGLFEAGRTQSMGNRWKIIFLFRMMNIPGLTLVYEEALRDINRTVGWLIDNEAYSYIGGLIQKTFSIIEKWAPKYPGTALSCVLNMGKGVYKTDELDLVNHFIDSVINLGFQAPMVDGVGNDWQIRVNSSHILNIRTWMELIELNPKFSTRLLSNLIIHLAISGVFIKDTDLFPKDITQLLNSDIGPVYNLSKQLTRLFPVYFNDIGAEGSLRDISTQLDELTHRRDVLIHFLRKQSHVESSNRILKFIEAVLRFWESRDKELLKPYVPPLIFEKIETRGIHIEGVHRIFTHLAKNGVNLPDDLLYLREGRLRRVLAEVEGITEIDSERTVLIINLSKLLNQKYNLGFLEIKNHIDTLNTEALPDLNRLRRAIDQPQLKRRIFMILDYMELLKEVILSPEEFAIKQDIYKKRHFTVDIPSMYGSYHEMKFDALGLTFRLEALVNVHFEELIANIDLSLITKATFHDIYDRLMLFNKALKLDGITSVELERQLDILAHSLEVRGFSFTQYLDIFTGFARAVRNITNDYFNNIHGKSLTRVLSRLPVNQILEKYYPQESAMDEEKLKHRTSEIFFRDRIALSLGLQQLDLFLSRILNTLYHQSSKLPKDRLRLLLNYDPQQAMISLVEPANHQAVGIIQLGNKGQNLLKLYNLGLPVPPGFIITTEVFRCRRVIDSFHPAEQNFKEQVAHQIAIMERITKKKFGDPKNPLLLSVRSGSSISQPGMMDTFLDVGINEKIAHGLAQKAGNTWFAWDSYRRFLQCCGMDYGLERDDFDAIIREFKQKLGIPLKKGFTGEQMREVALAYDQYIQDSGFKIPDDPLEQLHTTIQNVFDSWESSRAKTYRKIMGISDDWGTAVTVQEMVFGNLSQSSGSGVIFTHNPRWAGDTLSLWGDFTLENQGEDVVSGLVKTLPISLTQQEIEMRDTDITLESHFPDIYAAMKRWANMLIYEKGWSPQEMEFTFEGDSVDALYLLQTRDMAIRERKKVLTFDVEEKKRARYLGHGIGASGGAMSGRVVFNLEEMEKWRTTDPDLSLILVRGDTVPDDIREIHAADGLLTARGGVTSHAAVVAHRLGKTCVVGCGDMICDETAKTSRFLSTLIRSGDYISIDGREGSVYQGLLKINET